MVKDNETVIEEFNTLVNMTPSDLETWLGTTDSTSSGWVKSDGSGETVGHDSTPRKIHRVMTKDISHMRKVVAYCKRHLAQEEKAKQDTGSKSYKSLKNWGHDAQKS
ncbi:hypothetical protein LOCC1_G005778 [Lachnellula occidentalis]|uniref:Uncharacterized protein n=1 Tax=Lachnellula occidentalis TaxID=215460 RepID=A0A8H8RQF2_9HELO|nr:hypothetical protein LOCC1_G005778 [Lachnellula occidentalis]